MLRLVGEGAQAALENKRRVLKKYIYEPLASGWAFGFYGFSRQGLTSTEHAAGGGDGRKVQDEGEMHHQF